MMTARIVAAVASLCLATGCVVHDDTPAVIVAGDGFLTVDWSVDGSQDPDSCDLAGADSIDILVTTPGGATVGEFTEFCQAFVTSIELAPGTYAGDAVLLDRAGGQRTTAVDLGVFDIFGDDELSVSVDFPASSFY